MSLLIERGTDGSGVAASQKPGQWELCHSPWQRRPTMGMEQPDWSREATAGVGSMRTGLHRLEASGPNGMFPTFSENPMNWWVPLPAEWLSGASTLFQAHGLLWGACWLHHTCIIATPDPQSSTPQAAPFRCTVLLFSDCVTVRMYMEALFLDNQPPLNILYLFCVCSIIEAVVLRTHSRDKLPFLVIHGGHCSFSHTQGIAGSGYSHPWR